MATDGRALRDLNLTPQEAGAMAGALKDPHFAQLLGEYAQSLSDPAVKQETEAYLRQLEREGGLEGVLGQDVALVAPTPAFVVKTHRRSRGGKVFINVCSSDKVKEAASQTATDAATGRSGVRWDFPLVVGPLRDGTDKQGAACHVCDAAVHPGTLRAVAAGQRLKDLLMDAILERVESQAGCSLSRKYSCPKLRYKATVGAAQPPLLTVRAADKLPAAPKTAQRAERQRHSGIEELSSRSPPPSAPASSAGNGGGRSSFRFPRPATQGTVPATQDADEPLAAAARKQQQQQLAVAGAGEQAEQEPQHSMIHRGTVDLAEAWSDNGRLRLGSSRPKELVVRVELPGVDSLQRVDLQLFPTELRLAVPGAYRLQLALPFDVADAKARATFYRARQRLEVVLPVVQPQPPTVVSPPAPPPVVSPPAPPLVVSPPAPPAPPPQQRQQQQEEEQQRQQLLGDDAASGDWHEQAEAATAVGRQHEEQEGTHNAEAVLGCGEAARADSAPPPECTSVDLAGGASQQECEGPTAAGSAHAVLLSDANLEPIVGPYREALWAMQSLRLTCPLADELD